MKTFQIEAHLGIRDGIQFGMTRQEVHRLMAPAAARQFCRCEILVDGFYGATLQVTYDSNERVQFIEFARSDASVLLHDLDLLKSDASLVVRRISENHEMNESELGSSITFITLDLGFWRSDPEDAAFESVGFGRAGYYSKQK